VGTGPQGERHNLIRHYVGLARALVLGPDARPYPRPPGRTAIGGNIGRPFLFAHQRPTGAAYRPDLRSWFEGCAAQDVDPLTAQRGHVDAYARTWLRSKTAPPPPPGTPSNLSSFEPRGHRHHVDRTGPSPHALLMPLRHASVGRRTDRCSSPPLADAGIGERRGGPSGGFRRWPCRKGMCRTLLGTPDPRTTRRYDRARHNLDRHPTYALPDLVT
jgi:hypothetical protein